MMKFDLAPSLKSGYKQFLVGPAVGGVAMAIAAHILISPAWALALFRGSIVGLLDKVIMLHGIRRAMPYEKEPEKGLAIMRRYRWYRVIAASSIIIMLLKQGRDVTGVCIGLLLIHIFYLINLTFIAYRLNKEET
ncbi:MAG: hypothetical protein Q4E64_00185 [Phascolarctobacterium sp.]|uniref:hypothetical protein n=1 Tax=Phascolarctobacterium sp. TaxID=2049039 RepID=UPI0026DCD55A|nr:hypothetical protein [Phascolarctobacterium sp.]MDO4920240.1 hypothetical protein [Phascolarctobacterium sp.]